MARLGLFMLTKNNIPQDKQRLVRIEEDLLQKNHHFADQNRAFFNSNDILAIHLVSSPGAGKTTLLLETIATLKQYRQIYIINPQKSELDIDALATAGAIPIPLQTQNACHLDAQILNTALKQQQIPADSLLFIENTTDLTCPLCFDLGETFKVSMTAVTEGDNKAIKYPELFKGSDLLIISKIDLLPHTRFDMQSCISYARQINQELQVMPVSVTARQNLKDWTGWITDHAIK